MTMRRPTAILLALLAFAILAGCALLEGESPLTPEERRWVKDHPDGVKVGVGLHYPPYETFDLNGSYQGLSADFISLISEKTGLEFKPVRFRNRQETLKALLSGEVQVMAALEMTPSSARIWISRSRTSACPPPSSAARSSPRT
ncbi:transporter substrate-binding domain-containing protein [Desulfovibrio sp. Huiquan2017]|uniref:transporter substrate-binding domain-containing protein n=1 Tax=Desulfovibrio sp. Huiquan2017 TaxID=2816861 RepID=UPI001A9260E4|nr:transporter substrate-binding domain-containing protein [Desulfovibrio sp. Huiquan2017]